VKNIINPEVSPVIPTNRIQKNTISVFLLLAKLFILVAYRPPDDQVTDKDQHRPEKEPDDFVGVHGVILLYCYMVKWVLGYWGYWGTGVLGCWGAGIPSLPVPQ